MVTGCQHSLLWRCPVLATAEMSVCVSVFFFHILLFYENHVSHDYEVFIAIFGEKDFAKALSVNRFARNSNFFISHAKR